MSPHKSMLATINDTNISVQ